MPDPAARFGDAKSSTSSVIAIAKTPSLKASIRPGRSHRRSFSGDGSLLTRRG